MFIAPIHLIPFNRTNIFLVNVPYAFSFMPRIDSNEIIITSRIDKDKFRIVFVNRSKRIKITLIVELYYAIFFYNTLIVSESPGAFKVLFCYGLFTAREEKTR